MTTTARQGTARAAAVSRLLRKAGIAVGYADDPGAGDVRVERGFACVSVRVIDQALMGMVADTIRAAGYTATEASRAGKLNVTRAEW